MAMMRKIRVVKEILDLWPECRPEVGKVYDADYSEYEYRPGKERSAVIVVLAGKKVLLRMDEFEVVEDEHGR